MSILVDEGTKVICQGLTGEAGSFHSLNAVAYGTNMVAGVTPGRSGQEVEGIPVFNTVVDAVESDRSPESDEPLFTRWSTSTVFVTYSGYPNHRSRGPRH